MTPKQQYAAVAEALSSNSDVNQAKKNGFGSGLRINGKVFAMPAKDRLAVKLPPERIASLIASGKGEYYGHGTAKVSKTWVTVPQTTEQEWLALAIEAMEYASTKN